MLRQLSASVLMLALAVSATHVSGAPRFPEGANATFTVDVQKVLNSKYAEEQGWRRKVASNAADRPLSVPANATKVVGAAVIDLATMTPKLLVARIDTPTALNAERFAATRSGYVDTIEGKTVVRTSNGMYFMQLRPGSVASVWPAERRTLADWIRSGVGLTKTGNELPLDEDSAFAVSLDLADAYWPAGVFEFLRQGNFTSLDNFSGDHDKLAQLLASVQSITLNVRFGTNLTGEITVKFAQDATALSPNASGLLADAFAEAGMDPAWLERWSSSVKEDELTAAGPVGTPLMAALNRLFVPPAAPVTEAAGGGGAAGADATTSEPAGPAAAKAKASAEYYREVVKIIDGLNLQQPSLQQNAAYLRQQALALGRLHVLNVDPELQQWVGSLVEAFNRAAQVCVNGQSKAIAASDAVQMPTYSYNYDYYGYSQVSDRAQVRADYRNARQEKHRAGTEQRGQTLDGAIQLLNDAFAPRADLRMRMAEKYGVEF